MVLLQSYDHKLRSYKSFQCWILLTVLGVRESPKSYLVDAVSFKECIGSTIGAVCKTVDILKIVESQAIQDKLFTEFGCQI